MYVYYITNTYVVCTHTQTHRQQQQQAKDDQQRKPERQKRKKTKNLIV